MTLRDLLDEIRSTSIVGPAVALLWSTTDNLSKHLITVTVILVLASSIVSGLTPLLLKVVIDSIDPSRSDAGYLGPLYLVFGYALAHWLSRSLAEIRDMFHGRTDQRIQRQLSLRLFEHVMSLPLQFHLDSKTGALTQILSNGLMGYRMVLHHFLVTLLPITVEIATIATVLLFLDHAILLAIICISVLLYAIAFWTGIASIGKPARAVSEARINANAVLTDSILNYETVKYFGAETEVHMRFGDTLIRSEDRWTQLYRRKMENGLVVAGIFAASLAVLVYVAARNVQDGRMSIGEFVLVNAYVLQITQPLEMIGFAFRDIAEGRGWIAKMTELFKLQQEADVIGTRGVVPGNPPNLTFVGVSYAYRLDRFVIKNVNFSVPSGKTVAIVGESGSGKSSLIRLLMRLVEPTEGEIFLNEAQLSDIPIHALRSVIAVVPQHIALFNESIAYNIAIGKQGSTDADVVMAAKIALIHDFIVDLPDGYETKVGERGLKLSGGEKQRVAIARAAIKKPKIFVFDEVTSSLDARTEKAILRNLTEVTRMTTTLVIAHRLSTTVHADEIVVINHGTVIEHGSHAELMQQRGAYAGMWHAQHGQYWRRPGGLVSRARVS